MKLKKTFIVNKIAGETLAVPVGGNFHGIVKAVGCSDFILECLKKDSSEESIVEQILEEYDVSREKAAADVKRIVEQLRDLDAIEE